MIADLNKIAEEWSYRVGVIDYTDETHLYHLNEILREKGWTRQVIDEINQKLTEDDIVKNKKSGNTYVVKTHNPDTQDLIKKDASDDEIEKVDKGEEPIEKPGNKLRSSRPDLPIIYYIAPQEWAWRLGEGGTTDLIGFTDKILAIFKAESFGG